MRRRWLKTNASVMLMVSVLVFGAYYTGLMPPYEAQAAPGDLTKDVTHVFPTPNHVIFHLELKDDGVVVISKDYRHQWASGTTVQLEVKQKIGARMQVDIDAYKALSGRFNHADYETAANQIEAGLVL